MRTVLFACVGNALRSQMAEGWARHLARPGTLDARSGGTAPMGYVHPAAIRAMKERGVDITGHASKVLDLSFAQRADAFITLCGPLDDACPRPLVEKVIDWSMPDPLPGGETMVREVRDALESKVRGLLAEWKILRPDA